MPYRERFPHTSVSCEAEGSSSVFCGFCGIGSNVLGVRGVIVPAARSGPSRRPRGVIVAGIRPVRDGPIGKTRS